MSLNHNQQSSSKIRLITFNVIKKSLGVKLMFDISIENSTKE